jgi:2-desacetyl-2-hydroxyethyl bacteriochlorophyllide A dehydrogenase
MRTAVIHCCGAPQEIEIIEAEVPTPTRDEVLISVEYAAVNHVDTFVRSGAWATPMSCPFTVGRDAVGRVAAVGSAVDRFHPGQQVWCNSLGHDGRNGATAEFVTTSQRRVYPMPHGITPEEMAALAHPAATAQLALFRHARLTVNETVLIVGAAGNIGSAAVVLARAAAARVVATAHPRDHDYLRRLGADTVLDYRDDETFVARCSGEIDVILDTSGNNDLPRFVNMLQRHGRVVLIAGMTSQPVLPVGPVYLKSLNVTGFAISYATVDELENTARHLNWAVENLGLRPRHVEVLDLGDVATAHELLERGEVRGKLVIDITGRACAAAAR